MFCTQCGRTVPADANFCSACGTAVEPAPDGEDGSTSEAPTGAIDVPQLDSEHGLIDLPALPSGTALLVVVRGPNAGSRYLLDRDATSIGRHPDSHVFLDDVTVSRHHARVDHEDDTFVLYDLGSLNGTYLGAERVERRELRAGDELQVGRFKLLFVSAPV